MTSIPFDNIYTTMQEMQDQMKNIQVLQEQVKAKLAERPVVANKLENIMSVFNNQDWSNATQDNLKDASQKIMDAIKDSGEKGQLLFDVLSQFEGPQ